ncbi:unnamed protein product [Rotaria sp. Silwood1]|nr:unnamed protein product [Rotaria sp. Silwood1]
MTTKKHINSMIDYTSYKYLDLQKKWIICEGHLHYYYHQIKLLNISQFAMYYVVLAKIPIEDDKQFFVMYLYQNQKHKPSKIFQLDAYERKILRKLCSLHETQKVASFGTVSAKQTSTSTVETSIIPSSSTNTKSSDNIIPKKNDKSKTNTSSIANVTPPATPVNEQDKTQAKEQSSKPKSYRDAIGKKEKQVTTQTTNENQSKSAATGTKTSKSGKQKSSKLGNRSTRTMRGYPQDMNDYYDDSWYYRTNEEGYLHTGYTDDQEIFIGNLSAQVTEEEIHELFRPYGRLLLIRIGNTGSQIGAANFAFVVCQSIEMAKAIVADHENLLKKHQINVEAKKRRPFPHTFRPTYPTAASPTNYQSTGHPASFYEHSSSTPFYDGGIPSRGARRGGKIGTH